MPTVENSIPRNVGEVLDQMVAIPDLPSETKNNLEDIADSARYSAPEMIVELWKRIAVEVNYAVKEKTANDLRGWEISLVEIMTGKSITELRRQQMKH